jgi:hypothetical protein
MYFPAICEDISCGIDEDGGASEHVSCGCHPSLYELFQPWYVSFPAIIFDKDSISKIFLFRVTHCRMGNRVGKCRRTSHAQEDI